MQPAISNAPTASNMLPSSIPSISSMPSGLPSSEFERSTLGRFNQIFLVENDQAFLNITELTEMMWLFGNYTDEFAPDEPSLVTTECTSNVEDLGILPAGDEDSFPALTLRYRCRYTSRYVETSAYPSLLETFMNADLNRTTRDVQVISSSIIAAQPVDEVLVRSPAPTISAFPSSLPTGAPSFSAQPSKVPSDVPSLMPTPRRLPTVQPTFSPQPSASPTEPSSDGPSVPSSDGPSVGTIAGIVIVVGLASLAGLFVIYRRSKQACEARTTGGGPNDLSANVPVTGAIDFTSENDEVVAKTDSPPNRVASPAIANASKESTPPSLSDLPSSQLFQAATTNVCSVRFIREDRTTRMVTMSSVDPTSEQLMGDALDAFVPNEDVDTQVFAIGPNRQRKIDNGEMYRSFTNTITGNPYTEAQFRRHKICTLLGNVETGGTVIFKIGWVTNGPVSDDEE